jgi:hypothetical protein
LIVGVGLAVDVIGPVIVAALVNGNDAVAVADQGSMSLVSIATMRSSSSMPRSYTPRSAKPSTFMTSRCAADSIAEPLAIA